MTRRRASLMLVAACAGSWLTAAPRAARADRTFLVGGTVLEGVATRRGSKVVVQVESGEITLPADAVSRIERGESAFSRFDERYRALQRGDVPARLALADYCRDHDLRGRERLLLVEVLDLDSSNAVARARLGYVKTEGGWTTQAEAMRARGMVLHGGQRISATALQDTERAREAEASRARLQEGELELAARKAQVVAAEADLEARRAQSAPSPSFPARFTTGYVPSYGAPYAPYARPRAGFATALPDCVPGQDCGSRARPFVLRPSGSDAATLSVVKVPYRGHAP